MNAMRKSLESPSLTPGTHPLSSKTISLANLPVHQTATILAFQGGLELIPRLGALGFTPGAQVDMAQNYGRGPLIVTVRGAQVALGREEAAKISVQPKAA